MPPRSRSRQEPGSILHARYFAGELFRLKQILNQLRVCCVIFQQQNLQRGARGHFFMLPGGGSLMIAQKTPSSRMAFTNS